MLQAGFDYDAKTAAGFARFILPLILDSVFHRLAPKVFAPNGIRLLQARICNVNVPIPVACHPHHLTY